MEMIVKEKEKECGRGNEGHNSRKCCLKLFGVTINVSMDNLLSCNNGLSTNAGSLSHQLVQSRERKKGVPWTEEEHRTFLIGLKKLGKGNWRGISKKFVRTRTSIQVASHAQKYFRRQTPSQNNKRRSSLFDMSLEEPAPPPQGSPVSPLNTTAEIAPEASTFPLLPMAPTCGTPYMVGVLGNGFVPTRPSYGNFVTCAPVTFQYSPSIPVAQSLPHATSQPDLPASSIERDDLELKIALHQHPKKQS